VDDRSDSELVAASRSGDGDAFATLVDRHYARTRALARALLQDADEAADVTQEAVLQAYLGLEHLREPARFGAWLYGIAANLARMRLRTARRAVRAVMDGAQRGPDELAEAAETAALVREALGQLTPAQREAVLMHDVVGLTAPEIATRVGGSSGAVRVRLHRGRTKLRRQLSALAQTREEKNMVEVELRDVVVRLAVVNGEPELAGEHRILLLRERGGQRVLPIWVGAAEGDSLALHLGSEPVPRPLTADLMARLLEAAGASVESVEISTLRENTFYAVVHLVTAAGEPREADARPSDAINLAVRVGASIVVTAAVFDESALPTAEPADLDRELALVAEKFGLEPLEGTWTSLSPELVRTVGSFQAWRPPGASPTERENE
jgi:RNA polymerase sigma factor (sigma-70 family)